MERAMITLPRFVVSINGQQRCVAGFDGYAVLSAGIDFVRGREDEGPRSPLLDGAAHIRVGGLQGREHVDWLNDDLFVGDEVSIRVFEGGPFDPPSVRAAMVPGTCATMRPQMEARRERLAKIGNIIPHRFEVFGNGERFCMAGLEYGVLSMMLTWVRRDPATHPPHLSESAEKSEGGDVDLHVGGLKDDVHLDWCNVYVDVGDEIVVRILGPGPADPPQSRKERRRIPHEEGTVASTARRTLRKLVDDDLPFVSQLLGDAAAVARFQTPLTVHQSKQWLVRHSQYPEDYRGIWLIVDNESPKPVGLAGVLDVQLEGQSLPVVQCIIDLSHRRQKHGIESIWTCIWMVRQSAAWVGLKSSDAYALIRPGNEAALALASKLQMKSLRTVQHDGHEQILFVAKDRGD
jgi:RimJ/RimL family protein N-acetyltransferase